MPALPSLESSGHSMAHPWRVGPSGFLDRGIGASRPESEHSRRFGDGEKAMADDAKGFWQSAPGMLTGAAAVIAAITGLVVALKPVQATSTPPPDIAIPANPTHAGPSPSPAVSSQPQSPAQMGALEFNVGYAGNDLHPKGTLTLGSAQACANRCYEALDCKAMTYIRSTRRCWLKSAAANRAEASDEVSAVKR